MIPEAQPENTQADAVIGWVETATEQTPVVNAPALWLEHEPVPLDQSVAGSPSTGSVPLGEFGGREVGVWEMTVGTMTDIEVDEVFVVLSGQATVSIVGEDRPLSLVAGDVVILREGMQTTWTVTETLRKVYLA